MNLKNLKTEEDLKELIIDDWGYSGIGNRPTGIRLDGEVEKKVIDQKIIADYKGFQVLYFKLDESKKTSHQKIDGFMRVTEREIINNVEKYERNTKFFVFSSKEGDFWHFVNAISSEQISLRRFSIGPDNREKLRTVNDQLNKVIVTTGDELQDIIGKHKDAFDIEEVTTKFFRSFANHFGELISHISLIKRGVDKKEISYLAQIILNRIIFLKFIEKKGWLDNNKDYLYNKFQNYYDNSENSYWMDVVCPLFDLLSEQHKNPNSKLGNIPFLNGGLFGSEPKDLWSLAVSNDFFQSLFENLLNSFNFTIEESSPSSVEIAVDPEMLGRIFEALILVLEKSKDIEKDLRRATGSYYTPRVAVFHMCRSAIAKNLSSKTELPELDIKKLIDIAVNDIPDDKQFRHCTFNKIQINALQNAIEKISICDPAVGSGAFLLMSLQILVGLMKLLNLFLGKKYKENYDYILKEKVISRNLIGVDILKQAVHICELRLWLSLIVDYQDKDIDNLPTLPNLTYKIFMGDSIVDHLQGHSFDYLENLRRDSISINTATEQCLNNLKDLKNEYFGEKDEKEKEKLRVKIEKKKLELAIKILQQEQENVVVGEQQQLIKIGPKQVKIILEREFQKERKKLIDKLKNVLESKKIYKINDELVNFVWKIDLVEYFIDHGDSGFDIVIGNPPYGLKNESMIKGKERYGLGSKDSFGVFIAMSIKDLLRDGGILSFIVSNTWQTIKTHKPLRRLVLDNTKVHEFLMMPAWIFGATVNTSVVCLSKLAGSYNTNEIGIDNKKSERRKNSIIACDFTKAGKNTNQLEEYLHSLDTPKFYSDNKVAYYQYEQGLIEINSNIPFFIGSPKLFQFMSYPDGIVKLEDIADVKQGLATADNKYYLRKDIGARGNYEIIDHSLILKGNMINDLSQDEKKNGIDSKKYSGRYFLPYDKGGKSDMEEGWLPNYYVSTAYYIDWSKEAIKRMKTLTISERNGGKSDGRVASRFQNSEYYFKQGITFSISGQYAPTFRINSSSVFDVKGSCIFFIKALDVNIFLGLFNSKLIKYLSKVFIYHTVDFQVDAVKEMPFCINENNKMIQLVNQIIKKQKQDPRYDYMSNEQGEIDKLVYEMYGLNKDDIREVECWYARRYPKLERFCECE